ncbi:hypothetical protein AKJ52_02205 [candidate division MSBL1 archaeon SCGC-AAA382C18]|uniref:Uncharacterized protein n=1 Tax=candidate division MSBL1 archaeon SCGC-AAA382C18 TaxID=1698281 RepID=A0A133VJ16_9EURY|nr:hypothetical protein AKJ52_02205 [candidate division MSBL1 archaeon SCGC-AAA382C18]
MTEPNHRPSRPSPKNRDKTPSGKHPKPQKLQTPNPTDQKQKTAEIPQTPPTTNKKSPKKEKLPPRRKENPTCVGTELGADMSILFSIP